MQGLDPVAVLQSIAGRLGSLTECADLERALDEVENLYEVLDPDLQHLADGLIETLRRRLAQCAGHA